MKALILISLIISLTLNSCSSQENCTCEVLLKTNGLHKVYADNSINSKVLYVLNNDTIKENYFIVIIYQINNKWAKISAYSPNKEIKRKGWIQLSELGILTSDYPVLYNKQDKNSSTNKIKDYNYDYLNIIDCNKNWIKVKYMNKTVDYSGWLPPDNQCANPYTTCN